MKSVIMRAVSAIALLTCIAGSAAFADTNSDSAVKTSADPGFEPLITTVSVYPLAIIGSRDGGQFGLDFTYRHKPTDQMSYNIGGWYWSAFSGTPLYEAHAGVQVNNWLGFRGGYLVPATQHNNAWDGFATFTFAKDRFIPKSLHPEKVRPCYFQLAPGFLYDPAGGRSFVGFTGMATFGMSIGYKLNATVNYWYINDEGFISNRVLLGINRSF